MKTFAAAQVRLLAGLFLLAFGIALAYQSGLGLTPWDVLNDGLSRTLPITFGIASIGTGAIVLLIVVLCGERIGWGTVVDMLLFGLMFDLIMAFDLLPSFRHCVGLEALVPRLGLCAATLVVSPVGLYLYLSAALGAGPRDSLMCLLTKKSGRPVGLVRMGIEAVVLAIGFALGGTVGIGTLVLVFAGGPCMGLFFRMVRFDVGALRHQSLGESLHVLRRGKPGAKGVK